MAHAMMLDSGWQMVADRILGWLDETLPSGRRVPSAETAAGGPGAAEKAGVTAPADPN
jgi:hypothetical protein